MPSNAQSGPVWNDILTHYIRCQWTLPRRSQEHADRRSRAKKFVYLYLMNYAKTQLEFVILAVNTFVNDTDDPNPLVQALVIVQ